MGISCLEPRSLFIHSDQNYVLLPCWHRLAFRKKFPTMIHLYYLFSAHLFQMSIGQSIDQSGEEIKLLGYSTRKWCFVSVHQDFSVLASPHGWGRGGVSKEEACWERALPLCLQLKHIVYIVYMLASCPWLPCAGPLHNLTELSYTSSGATLLDTGKRRGSRPEGSLGWALTIVG